LDIEPRRRAFWLALAGVWGLTGVAGAHLLFRFNAGALDYTTFFTSDNLYLPALYRDLFEEGGRWSGWRLTPAPYFFPDMGLYFALDALTGPFTQAIVSYAVVQFVLLGLSSQHLAATLAPRDTAPLAQVLAVGAVAALLLTCAAGRLELMQYSVLSATHFSLVMLAQVGLALALRAVRDGSRLAAGLLALLCLLAGLSDSLFTVCFIVPAVLCLGLLAWLGRPSPWRWAGTVAGLMVLAMVLGNSAQRWVLAWRPGGYTRLRPERVWDVLGLLGRALREQYHATPGVALLWLALVLLALGVVLSRWRTWARPGSACWGLYALCLFTVLAVGTNTGAVVLTGQFEEKAHFRYLLVPALLPFLGLALVPGLLRGERARRAVAVAGLGLVALAAGVSVLRHPWRTEGPLRSDYAPPLVECLDSQRARQGLEWGVAGYWAAKSVTMFSRTGLRVHQVTPDGGVNHWISNIDWYLDRRGEGSDYTFILSEGLDLAALRARYGPPRETLHCGHHEVLVYGPALDAPLRAAFAAGGARQRSIPPRD
jgi:hypothetical protein